MEVIDSEGEAGVRVNHIVDAAGVTPPTLYHYFGSRDGLIVEAQAERFVRIIRKDMAMLRTALESVRTPRQMRAALETVSDVLMAPSRRGGRLARINILGSTLARPELARRLAAAQEAVFRNFTEMFAPLQERGLIRPDVHLPTAIYWISGLFTSRFLIEMGENGARTTAWDDFTRKAVVDLLLAPPTRP